MNEEPDVFLSLGSNLGDRLRNLQGAVSKLSSHPHLTVVSISPVYRTEPLYDPEQADFFNCAVRLKTDLKPRELLQACLNIEQQMGRKRDVKKYSSRLIDLDIIFYGNQRVSSTDLTVPHPRYAERNFVLVPLSDIAPDLVCPDTGMTVEETLRDSKDGSTIEVIREAEMT